MMSSSGALTGEAERAGWQLTFSVLFSLLPQAGLDFRKVK